MKTSRQQLSSYSIPNDRYFPTRNDRNAYFSGATIDAGTYCAVAEDPYVDMLDETTALWYLEEYNGVNWTLVSIDESYALVVTNDGLKALTYAEEGSYKLKISRVAIREESVPIGADLVNWNENYFKFNSNSESGNYNRLVLDTGYTGNTTFTLAHNFSWRYNLSNGGLQYTVLLDTDVIGLDFAHPINDPDFGTTSYNQKNEFYIGAIGLFVEDPENPGSDILFAVGNLSTPIYKYSSTATRIGNALKLYLNTTLTNLGYVSDLTTLMESVTSIPEVPTDSYLANIWDGSTAPHNLYLVDDLNGSGIPALAVRQGNPTIGGSLHWVYFSPTDNSIVIDRESDVDSSVKDYMVVAWNGNRYVPARGEDDSLKTQGIIVGNTILYNGMVTNSNKAYKYTLTMTDGGRGYSIGDKFRFTAGSGDETITFIITVTDIITGTGKVKSYNYTPLSGDYNLSASAVSPVPVNPTPGTGLVFDLISTNTANTSINWNFDQTWINKPLFVSESNPGILTITETPRSDFVGWCKSTNSIQLALDLRTEATDNTYGTTRYAIDNEIKNAKSASNATRTSVTPRRLQENYLQITSPDSASDGKGSAITDPIQVNTFVKFNKMVIGSNVSAPSTDQSSDISFYGTSYRALWGDLAEYYRSDRIYSAGTLITIGNGVHSEITLAREECNGIISDKPGYVLGDKKDDYDLPVALIGKVPVKFAKDCDPQFGDKIYLSKNEPGRASTIPYGKCLGKIIDKDKDLNRKSIIMCSVRLSF